jgi:Xaa-Pro aminopeptidase
VGHTPLLHAMGILRRSGRLDLYAEPSKLAGVALPEGVAVSPEAALAGHLAAETGRIRVDRSSAPQAAVDALGRGQAEIVPGRDPCILPKARKTAPNSRRAGRTCATGWRWREFLRWFDETAPAGGLTEIDVVRALEGFRAETGALRDISFDTIAGAGRTAPSCITA